MSDFAKNLKALRTKKGLSQEELALTIGVHSTHLSRYERGLSVPAIEIVQKIALAFNISIGELVFGLPNEKAKKAIEDVELLSSFSKVQGLDTKKQQTIKDLISAFVLKANLQEQLS